MDCTKSIMEVLQSSFPRGDGQDLFSTVHLNLNRKAQGVKAERANAESFGTFLGHRKAEGGSGQMCFNEKSSQFHKELLSSEEEDEVIDLSMKKFCEENEVSSDGNDSSVSNRGNREFDTSGSLVDSSDPPKARPPLLPYGLEVQVNEIGQYVCMFCSKIFAHKYPYRDHVRTHTGDSPRCELCLKSFPKNHNLMLHMRTHTGEKPFVCPICMRGFADKSNLKVHMRVHTGDRPYKCDFCNRGFANTSRMIVHRKLHTGEKPFVCQVCNLSFQTKYQRLTHMKCHRRSPPKETFHEVMTIKHTNSQVAGQPYRCFHCGTGYAEAASLQSHIVIFHSKGSEM